MTIAELLEATNFGLTATLHALQDVRQFQLIEFIEPDGRLQLTAGGSRTMAVLTKQRIQSEAERLLPNSEGRSTTGD